MDCHACKKAFCRTIDAFESVGKGPLSIEAQRAIKAAKIAITKAGYAIIDQELAMGRQS